MGQAYGRMGKEDQAKKYLNQVLAVNPNGKQQ